MDGGALKTLETLDYYKTPSKLCETSHYAAPSVGADTRRFRWNHSLSAYPTFSDKSRDQVAKAKAIASGEYPHPYTIRQHLGEDLGAAVVAMIPKDLARRFELEWYGDVNSPKFAVPSNDVLAGDVKPTASKEENECHEKTVETIESTRIFTCADVFLLQITLTTFSPKNHALKTFPVRLRENFTPSILCRRTVTKLYACNYKGRRVHKHILGRTKNIHQRKTVRTYKSNRLDCKYNAVSYCEDCARQSLNQWRNLE